MTSAARSLSLRWAANGALAGTAAAAMLMWFDRAGPPGWQHAVFLLSPGLFFGLAVGIPLSRRSGLAPWRLPAFVAGSVLGWPAAWYASLGAPYTMGRTLPAVLEHGLDGLIAGLVWSLFLLLGAWGFPAVSRRPARIRLLLAGGGAGALCLVFLEPLGKLGFGAVFLTLWGIWYAVQGAVFAALVNREGNGT